MEELLIKLWLCFWLGVLGAALGSFLDCAASRRAAGEPHPFRGRSHCGACGHTLGAADLIPVLSFLLRRGKCRYCGQRIPPDCLFSELAGAAILAAVGARFGLGLELGQWLIFAALLLALSLEDAFRRILPDGLLLALAANRILWFFLLGQGIPEALAILPACAIPAAVLGLTLLWEKRSGREVMGGGDIKLLFALALYLNWAQLLLALMAGCLLGLAWAALTRRRKGATLPFGPFLAGGALAAVCFAGPLLDWYFSLF